MFYTSTRGAVKVSPSEAIVGGIAPDGGLYVPVDFPVFGDGELEGLISKSYPERAATVLGKFLTDFSYDELLDYAERAYGRFDGEPAPVVKLEDGNYILELWHGPTSAFKDLALTILPYLLTAARRKTGAKDKTLILVATSGDTGKAALEGFKDVEGTEIIVFYPSDGVSYMQKLQMVTQRGGNVHVCGINGNFDDAQTAVKGVFTSEDYIKKIAAKGYSLSSANSINWGRLAPQIAYYASSYLDLVSSGEIAMGDKVNYCVPSGNFGNILAGYYARKMGVPIDRLICASNVNNVLTDFFNTGVYDSNREFYKTKSPSMDILVSSNLERLLFELSGRNTAYVLEKMHDLKVKGRYKIDKSLTAPSEIVAGWADEDETAEAMCNFFDVYDYVLDPHTAVAASVCADYVVQAEDDTPTVIVSTANPYKFATDVYFAIAESYVADCFKAIKKLSELTALDIPDALAELKTLPVLHDKVVDKGEIGRAVLDFLNED